MVMTVLEAHVAPEQWAALEQAFAGMSQHTPPQLVQSFLVQSTADRTLWRAMAIWRSREALQEYQHAVPIPAGVQMFQALGAEPTLALFDLVG